VDFENKGPMGIGQDLDSDGYKQVKGEDLKIIWKAGPVTIDACQYQGCHIRDPHNNIG
jgi:hypothetical protein